MIKRRFYKQEHADKYDTSDSSSSSSDSELEAEGTEEVVARDDAVAKFKGYEESCSSSSGYESKDSSANEVDAEPSGNAEMELQSDTIAAWDSFLSDVPNCILKCKSVFKCKLCPKIVCLTEETLRAHLKSKRHARSEKLLKEGRLKLMLNSDGELEEEEETHSERHARIINLAQDNRKRKNKGRQRQRLRLKRKKVGAGSEKGNVSQSMKNPVKKRPED
ncbi:uncharacterized protein LOC131165713 isoform X1 [Malania oleifera]|uniref:uncharacterized protein LOC131165713 isoform X1 n=1 Tax=Malania oleifera TaxID=397392 RepID=UPI0025AEA33F|nr:uncharacterized protein LOC131165713 isoform X1 [Malania oleifera]